MIFSDIEIDRTRINHAIILIQSAWRGYLVRKELKRLHAAATIIQKHVRGFLTRINLPKYLLQILEAKNKRFYDEMATKIQALWRGYAVSSF